MQAGVVVDARDVEEMIHKPACAWSAMLSRQFKALVVSAWSCVPRKHGTRLPVTSIRLVELVFRAVGRYAKYYRAHTFSAPKPVTRVRLDQDDKARFYVNFVISQFHL